MDRTPQRLEDRPADPKYLLLPVWLSAILKGREAWQDRRGRRSYEGPQAQAARQVPWTCSLCGSDAQGSACGACGATR